MKNDLALVFEIYRDARADNRLDLAQSPIGFDAVTHDGANFNNGF